MTEKEPKNSWVVWITLSDVLMFVGVALVAYGTWLVYRPAAFILVGVALIVWAVLDARATVLGGKNGGN